MKQTLKKLCLSTAALAFAFSNTAFAHPHETAPKAEAAAEATAETAAPTAPALWKVADEDTTIYLFGTVHILPKDVEWYNAEIATALTTSDELVTEIYMPEGSEMQAQQAFLAKANLPEGQSLRDLLSEEQKESYEAAMTKLGLPVASFDTFEPWFAAINLSMLPLLQAGYSPDAGVETVLEAKVPDTPRGELETIEFQVGVFDGLPMESQIKFLMETADGVDEIVPSLDAMVNEWAKGDPETLGDLMNEGFSDPALAEALLYKRNSNWAQWIDTRLDTPGTVFIAVGAGHLAGEQSVQDALASIGIETTRVQ
ncbi:TraB/GumN family protein [Pontixanthobacter aquaemixtae]|uniref:TraB/GumN family protein n=1 Tax=Pontixanthobacter aquaemixtae TaxID=1958940 RepID=A0A844ZPB4_9SPHN|nr:TraB/GumN family protein [Pontixanthobacter aquaemixtae]MXO90201.1 TraB/GumN family protein [Pontixanthobacter aquaemixtae]